MKYRNHSAPILPFVAFGVIALSILGVATVPVAWSNTHNSEHSCTVENKDRTTKSQGGSDMRVYTTCGVFSVADDWINGQWNSADVYSKIELGKTYDFNTVGWRNGFFSQFPNIIGIKPAT